MPAFEFPSRVADASSVTVVGAAGTTQAEDNRDDDDDITFGSVSGSQSGDVLILFTAADQSYTASHVDAFFSAHGFTEISKADRAVEIAVGYKTLTGAFTGATYSQTGSSSNIGDGWSAAILILRGGTYNSDSVNTYDDSANGKPDPGALTTATQGDLGVVFGALDDDFTDMTAPSGWTLQATDKGEDGPADLFSSLAVATKEYTSTASDDPGTFGGSTSDRWQAEHFSFSPT